MSDFGKVEALRVLKGRKVVNSNGTVTVKVTSVHPHDDKHIVNVNAMNLFGANQAKALLMDGEYVASCNTNLSFNVFEGQTCPDKGQLIDVVIDDIKLKDGSTAKLIAGWSKVAEATVSTFSFDDVEEEVEEPAEAESGNIEA